MSNDEERMRKALERCEEQFRYYEEQHRSKAGKYAQLNMLVERNDTLQKADVNKHFATMCREAREG